MAKKRSNEIQGMTLKKRALLGEIAMIYYVMDLLKLLPKGKLEQFDEFVQQTGGVTDWKACAEQQVAKSFSVTPDAIKAAYKALLEHQSARESAYFVLRGLGCSRMPEQTIFP
ncbi:MAG: hypothetical protein EXS16_19315 [Gemmataceae bacterium]|nr:hypothetical protein [Gemmataceae bacterium]